jgi:hypothetical protein
LGKIVLGAWRADAEVKSALEGASYHVRKQVAAVALLLADAAMKAATADLRAKGLTLDSVPTGSQGELELVGAVVRAIAEGRAGKTFVHALIGAYERTKHIGLYVDSGLPLAGLTHRDFTAEDVDGWIEITRRAIGLLRDWRTVHVARPIVLARRASPTQGKD